MSRADPDPAVAGARSGAGAAASPGVASPSDFRFHHDVEVRFRDLDPMGHVHHSLPLMYWEEARARYWREVAGRETVEAIDYVMGAFTLRFHERIRFPSRLRAGARVVRLGRSSWEMEYGLWDGDGLALVSGRSTQVMFDYDRGRSKPLDPETRARIEAFEGRRLT